MDLHIILSFLISLLLTVISAWSLGTFIRLERASKKNNFETSCQISKLYVTVGYWIGIVITILSLLILALSSYNVYKLF